MDGRLRELERRWCETADPYDGAAWLRERIRGSELALERVKLAAALGDAPARALVGPIALVVRVPRPRTGWLGALVERVRPRETDETPFDLESWVQSLEPWGLPVQLHAVLIAVRSIQPYPSRLVDLAQAWCDCPCSSHSEAARVSGDDIIWRSLTQTMALCDLAAAAVGGAIGDSTHRQVDPTRSIRMALRISEAVARDGLDVWRVARESLLAWALGRASPAMAWGAWRERALVPHPLLHQLS